MTRTYTLVIDGEPGAYGAYVPEIESILVTGKTIDEITSRARTAIQMYREHVGDAPPSSIMLRTVDVEVSA
jgi:predicted RNase H-like HicB family nuclease